MRRLIALVAAVASFAAAPAFADPCEYALERVDAAMAYHKVWADHGLPTSQTVYVQLLAGRTYLQHGWHDPAVHTLLMATHSSLAHYLPERLNEVVAAAVECRDGHTADTIDDVTLRNVVGYHNVRGGFVTTSLPGKSDFALVEENSDDTCLESGAEIYLRQGSRNYTGNKGWTEDTGYSESWRLSFDGGGCVGMGDSFVLNSNYGGIELNVTVHVTSEIAISRSGSIHGATLIVSGLRLVNASGHMLRRSGNSLAFTDLKHRWTLLQADANGDCIRSGDSVYLHQDFTFWDRILPYIFDGQTGRFTITSEAEGCIGVGDTIELSAGPISLSGGRGFLIE